MEQNKYKYKYRGTLVSFSNSHKEKDEERENQMPYGRSDILWAIGSSYWMHDDATYNLFMI